MCRQAVTAVCQGWGTTAQPKLLTWFVPALCKGRAAHPCPRSGVCTAVSLSCEQTHVSPRLSSWCRGCWRNVAPATRWAGSRAGRRRLGAALPSSVSFSQSSRGTESVLLCFNDGEISELSVLLYISDVLRYYCVPEGEQ